MAAGFGEIDYGLDSGDVKKRRDANPGERSVHRIAPEGCVS